MGGGATGELHHHRGHDPLDSTLPASIGTLAGRKWGDEGRGAFEIELPRNRIGKGQTRIDGLDDKIIAMYACGMSVRDIRGHLEEFYGLEVFRAERRAAAATRADCDIVGAFLR